MSSIELCMMGNVTGCLDILQYVNKTLTNAKWNDAYAVCTQKNSWPTQTQTQTTSSRYILIRVKVQLMNIEWRKICRGNQMTQTF